jgi:hypothetical protein
MKSARHRPAQRLHQGIELALGRGVEDAALVQCAQPLGLVGGYAGCWLRAAGCWLLALALRSRCSQWTFA